jgi:hypothetical protein
VSALDLSNAADFDGTNPDQGNEEWLADRAGCFTASILGALCWEPGTFASGPRKGQPKPPPKMRMDQIDRVVAEILTGRPKEIVTAKALDYGKEMEPEALAAYEARTGRLVEQCGFLHHPEYPFIGASPDFLVDDDGGGEIKCPMSIVVHATTLREGLPEEHIEQIQGGLWVTGRKWWDFISYNPHFPAPLNLYVQRVLRDDVKIAELRAHTLSAWDEVQAVLQTLQQRIGE